MKEENVLFNDRLNTFFYMHHPTDRIAHTTAFVIPIVKESTGWNENSSMGPP